MINTESRKAVYRSLELITLKEAKDKYEHLTYLEWLKDNDLGYIQYTLEFDYMFYPVTRKGEQLFEE